MPILLVVLFFLFKIIQEQPSNFFLLHVLNKQFLMRLIMVLALYQELITCECAYLLCHCHNIAMHHFNVHPVLSRMQKEDVFRFQELTQISSSPTIQKYWDRQGDNFLKIVGRARGTDANFVEGEQDNNHDSHEPTLTHLISLMVKHSNY